MTNRPTFLRRAVGFAIAAAAVGATVLPLSASAEGPPRTCATYETDGKGQRSYYVDTIGPNGPWYCGFLNGTASNLVAPFDPDTDLPPSYFWLCSYPSGADMENRVWTDSAHLRSAQAQCAGSDSWNPTFTQP